MIKQIDEIPKGYTQVDKLKLAVNDIRTIIDNRIAKSEIINPVYSESSCYDGYKRAIRKAVVEIMREKGKGYVNAFACFQIIHRKIEGKLRWFIMFDAENWDRLWNMKED